MDWDQLAEEKSQKLYAGWLKLLLRESPALTLKLATQHRPGFQATSASDFTTGSFNMCSIVTFEDDFRALVRFPILSQSRFCCKKTSDELLMMAFIARHTSIPVPTIIGTGKWSCDSYIVTTVVEGSLLSKLRDPSKLAPSLNPDVSESDLKTAYSGMAQIVLDLFKPVFKYIGVLQ
ncbi:hypothetical protein AJ78_05578 [Emergomyces pasteurianus Ep9510]|uniref:Aminoglycoside phosphotransferase domain-containing protein n=1 Tax=Emergomyces pasteurianus Ep9510 TaxID=1447872 RepID=A0A1J9QD28_9EURO|nr:hypothetical protein AJ78_05578 [Emergomyces pasteurianus Ep9510]